MANENRIQIKGTNYRYEEDRAFATITPGDLIEFINDAGVKKVRRHATEGGPAERAFAVESPLQGQTAFGIESRTIDTDYAAGELVSYHLVLPGHVVRAHLKAGENVAIGALLHSAGDGSLIATGSMATASSTEQPVAKAEEALDLSASGAVKSRINVRVL